MKKALLYLLFLFLISNVDARPNSSITQPDLRSKNYSSVQNDSITAVVNKFLLWYKKNYQKLKIIKFVPQDSGNGTVQYRVDFKAVDSYLKILKSSSCLSNQYLAVLRKHFEDSDRKMARKKQKDGPPEGLEGDLILKTQEVQSYLAIIEQGKMKFYLPIQKNNTADICVQLISPFKFSLVEESGEWKIVKTGWPEIGESCE